MARRKIFDKCGVFDETFPVCEDYDLWLRIMLAGEQFGFISKPLVTRYAGHAGQLSTRYEAMDRFRAKSLYKLLQTVKMPVDRYELMKDILHKKSRILLAGAKKRSHYEDEKIFQSYLDF
jgi:GT2 family glycosyltransferase